MEPDDAPFFDTVMQVVHRYGMKRTTMAELAHGAGVSRQTLYDRFGDKDGVMAATINNWGARIMADLRAAFAEKAGLAERIDAYYDIVVWPTFDLLQQMPDAADFQRGMGPKSVAATQTVSELKQKAVAEMLADHFSLQKQSADVAEFFEQSSARAKMSDGEREDLERFLAVLKASVLALAR